MEFVQGIPITEHCDKNRLTTRERLELFTRVCEGVQHAHQKAIIHRDLKPSNILVAVQDGRPVPKIIDFGVAKATAQALTERTMYTELGVLIGTPAYMSPEQAEMSRQDVDTRADVYSLGVILYELLIGALPFDPKELRRAGFDEILRKIREVDPPKPSTKLSTMGEDSTVPAMNRRMERPALIRQMRGDLDWIAMKALEKDRARRYGSPSDLAADIDRYLRLQPIVARPPSPLYKAKKFVRRHRVGVGVAAALAALLVAFSATTAVQARRIARERDRANQEAETSRRISDFLTGLFQVSDPSEARGNSVTAREILDKGAGKIGAELGDQPAIQARLMDTIGTVYTGLGLYDRAESILEQSLKIKRSLYGEDDLGLADTLQNIGIVVDNRGQFEKSASYFQQALDIRRKTLGEDDPEVGKSLNSLAISFYNQGRWAEAEPLFERSLAIKEKTLGPDDPGMVAMLTNLGILKHAQQKFTEAEPLLKRALDITEKTKGADHPELGTMLNNLGTLYEDQGRREEAEPLYVRSLAIWEKALGPDHPDVAITVHNLANLYRNMGKPDRAEPLYLRSLAVWEKALGPKHPFVAVSLRERANLYRDVGRPAEAEPLYQRAIAIQREVLGGEHPDLAKTMIDYGALLLKAGRAKEAEKYILLSKKITDKAAAPGK